MSVNPLDYPFIAHEIVTNYYSDLENSVKNITDEVML